MKGVPTFMAVGCERIFYSLNTAKFFTHAKRKWNERQFCFCVDKAEQLFALTHPVYLLISRKFVCRSVAQISIYSRQYEIMNIYSALFPNRRGHALYSRVSNISMNWSYCVICKMHTCTIMGYSSMHSSTYLYDIFFNTIYNTSDSPFTLLIWLFVRCCLKIERKYVKYG